MKAHHVIHSQNLPNIGTLTVKWTFVVCGGHLSGRICEAEPLLVPNYNHRPEFGLKYLSFLPD